MSRSKLNKTAKLAFYTARKKEGDNKQLAETTGVTVRYVNDVLSGKSSITDELANKMYNMSVRRMKTSELA